MTKFYKRLVEISQNGYAEIAKATGENNFYFLHEIYDLIEGAYLRGFRDGRVLEAEDMLEKRRKNDDYKEMSIDIKHTPRMGKYGCKIDVDVIER